VLFLYSSLCHPRDDSSSSRRALALFRPTSWIRTHSISGIPDAPGFGVPWSWSSLCTPGRPGLRCACTALARQATIRCSVHSWSCLSTPRDPGMSDDRSRCEVPLWLDLGSNSYGSRRGSRPRGVSGPPTRADGIGYQTSHPPTHRLGLVVVVSYLPVAWRTPWSPRSGRAPRIWTIGDAPNQT